MTKTIKRRLKSGGQTDDPPYSRYFIPETISDNTNTQGYKPVNPIEVAAINKKKEEVAKQKLYNDVGTIKRTSNDQSNPEAFNALTGMTNKQFTDTYDNEFIAAAGLSGLYKVPGSIMKGISNFRSKSIIENVIPGILDETKGYMVRGVNSKDAISDIFKSGVVKTKSTSKYGNRVFWTHDQDPLLKFQNRYTIKVPYNPKFRKEPVTLKDIEEISFKGRNGINKSIYNKEVSKFKDGGKLKDKIKKIFSNKTAIPSHIQSQIDKDAIHIYPYDPGKPVPLVNDQTYYSWKGRYYPSKYLNDRQSRINRIDSLKINKLAKGGPVENTNKQRQWLVNWYSHPEAKRRLIEYGRNSYGTKYNDKTATETLNKVVNRIKNVPVIYDYNNDRYSGIFNLDKDRVEVYDTEDVSTSLHELTHASGIGSKNYQPVEKKLRKSRVYGKLDKWMHTPEEAIPYINELRFNSGIKPGEIIDQEKYNKMKTLPANEGNKMFNVFDEDAIYLLNTVASNNKNIQQVKDGGVIKPGRSKKSEKAKWKTINKVNKNYVNPIQDSIVVVPYNNIPIVVNPPNDTASYPVMNSKLNDMKRNYFLKKPQKKAIGGIISAASSLYNMVHDLGNSMLESNQNEYGLIDNNTAHANQMQANLVLHPLGHMVKVFGTGGSWEDLGYWGGKKQAAQADKDLAKIKKLEATSERQAKLQVGRYGASTYNQYGNPTAGYYAKGGPVKKPTLSKLDAYWLAVNGSKDNAGKDQKMWKQVYNTIYNNPKPIENYVSYGIDSQLHEPDQYMIRGQKSKIAGDLKKIPKNAMKSIGSYAGKFLNVLVPGVEDMPLFPQLIPGNNKLGTYPSELKCGGKAKKKMKRAGGGMIPVKLDHDEIVYDQYGNPAPIVTNSPVSMKAGGTHILGGKGKTDGVQAMLPPGAIVISDDNGEKDKLTKAFNRNPSKGTIKTFMNRAVRKQKGGKGLYMGGNPWDKYSSPMWYAKTFALQNDPYINDILFNTNQIASSNPNYSNYPFPAYDPDTRQGIIPRPTIKYDPSTISSPYPTLGKSIVDPKLKNIPNDAISSRKYEKSSFDPYALPEEEYVDDIPWNTKRFVNNEKYRNRVLSGNGTPTDSSFKAFMKSDDALQTIGTVGELGLGIANTIVNTNAYNKLKKLPYYKYTPGRYFEQDPRYMKAFFNEARTGLDQSSLNSMEGMRRTMSGGAFGSYANQLNANIIKGKSGLAAQESASVGDIMNRNAAGKNEFYSNEALRRMIYDSGKMQHKLGLINTKLALNQNTINTLQGFTNNLKQTGYQNKQLAYMRDANGLPARLPGESMEDYRKRYYRDYVATSLTQK